MANEHLHPIFKGICDSLTRPITIEPDERAEVIEIKQFDKKGEEISISVVTNLKEKGVKSNSNEIKT